VKEDKENWGSRAFNPLLLRRRKVAATAVYNPKFVASPTGVNHKTATVELGTHLRGLNSMYRDYGVGKVTRSGTVSARLYSRPASLSPLRICWGITDGELKAIAGSVGGYGEGQAGTDTG